jgi:hypothetical protein
MQPLYRIEDSWKEVMESKRKAVNNALFKKMSMHL